MARADQKKSLCRSAKKNKDTICLQRREKRKEEQRRINKEEEEKPVTCHQDLGLCWRCRCRLCWSTGAKQRSLTLFFLFSFFSLIFMVDASLHQGALSLRLEPGDKVQKGMLHLWFVELALPEMKQIAETLPACPWRLGVPLITMIESHLTYTLQMCYLTGSGAQ